MRPSAPRLGSAPPAKLRATGPAADDDTARRMRDLNGELERMTRTARQAADAIREQATPAGARARTWRARDAGSTR